MSNNIFDRYKELLNLGVKVTESAYVSSSELFGGFKYVDKTLYNSWRYQAKDFIQKYFGETIYFEEFEKIDNASGLAGGTNKDKFEKQLTLLTSLKYNLEHLKINKKENSLKNNNVFIVHGHKELAISQVTDVIRKLGLNPIILRDQVSQSSTVIEKIEKFTSDVGFGIVLYTECDWGGKEKELLKRRARQNVVLEHGYLMAKLGRKNTMALVKGEVETPSDISGVVYTSMDDYKAWQYKLADELKASGYSIDKNML